MSNPLHYKRVDIQQKKCHYNLVYLFQNCIICKELTVGIRKSGMSKSNFHCKVIAICHRKKMLCLTLLNLSELHLLMSLMPVIRKATVKSVITIKRLTCVLEKTKEKHKQTRSCYQKVRGDIPCKLTQQETLVVCAQNYFPDILEQKSIFPLFEMYMDSRENIWAYYHIFQSRQFI